MENKFTKMKIEYKGKEYLLDLLSDDKKHYGIIHINDDIKIKFSRNQSKSIQTDFKEKMDEYFSKPK
jgi:hypothetical protein